ncbi:MAG: flagellar export chaperone FliS [Porticoccaceae bacterium]|nr:flagellar export chaperone FliS [Porticoccaceae bacterium]OUS10625.1 flagellar export chaperone FliS [Gammaproteobacteria bacterium 54_18_T64]
MSTHAGLNQYRQMQSHSQIAEASPHQLVAMLFQGSLDNLAVARGAIERDELALKGEKIGRTLEIIDNLRTALDMEAGGEVSLNLRDLYDYMAARLLKASVENSVPMVEEVAGLLREIQQGWNAMPEEFKKAPSRHAEDR